MNYHILSFISSAFFPPVQIHTVLSLAIGMLVLDPSHFVSDSLLFTLHQVEHTDFIFSIGQRGIEQGPGLLTMKKLTCLCLPLPHPHIHRPTLCPRAAGRFLWTMWLWRGSGISVAWGQLDMKSYSSPSSLLRASALNPLWPGFWLSSGEGRSQVELSTAEGLSSLCWRVKMLVGPHSIFVEWINIWI